MTNIKFDSEQEEAINFTGSNIMVSASAGAGKTNVLVHRLLKRNIIDRIPLDHILALTFTKAAASEMKKRLATKLHEQFQQANDEELKNYLQEQLILLESAQITTIDSFCVTLIKKYCNVLGMDPSTADNVISDSLKMKYYKSAFDDVISKYEHEHKPEILKVLEYFEPRSENYSNLFGIIQTINLFADNSSNPDGWFIKARANYQKVKHFNDLPKDTLNYFFDYLLSFMQRIGEELKHMETFSDGDENVDLAILSDKRAQFINCLNALEEKNYNHFISSFKCFCNIKTSSSGNNGPYTDARKNIVKFSDKVAENLYDEKIFINDHNDLCDVVYTLLDLSQETKRRFIEIKLENACLDFSDMGRYVYEILKANNGSTAKIIQNQYDEIMVDEFQDTSELQNTIIEMISNGHNIFRVGDVKQSIYRFRQAKPDLMRSIRKNHSVKNITFKHNYRSKQSIVKFTNLLFSQLMNIDGCKDEYLEDDNVNIGENNEFQKETDVPIEFIAIKDTKKTEWKENQLPIDNKTAKANCIAQKMIALKNNDPSILWSQFAVLVKSHGDKAYLKTAFNRYGIPYAINAKEGFFNSELCLTISSIVSYLMNQNDEISLLSICTSELFDLTDEECAQCKIIGNQILLEHSNKQKEECEKTIIFDKPFTLGIKNLHNEIISFLDELKNIADKNGILDMLDSIACKNQFYEKLDPSQQANWDYLINTVVNSKINNLLDFHTLMIEGKDENSSEAMSIGKNDDVVKVETIHHSKGLEYEYVFLWSSSSQNSSNKESKILIDGNGHIAFSHIDLSNHFERKTIEELGLSIQIEKESLEEFVRILYVAVTRAVKRLFVFDTIKNEIIKKDVNLPLLQERGGFSNLFLSVLKPSSLFQIHEVSAADLSQENAKQYQKLYVHSLPHFDDKEIKLYPNILKPSATEFSGLQPIDETISNNGTNFGTTVHELLEKLPTRSWTRDDIPKTTLSENYINKIINFGNSDLYKKCLTMTIHKEWPFYVETDNKIIEGIMDFVAIGENEIILIDYKTDNANIDEIKKRYSEQLNTYRKALTILYPNKQIDVYAYSLFNEIAIPIPSNLYK